VVSGDVVRGGHGGHRPALRETADSSLSLGLNGSRPLDDQWVGLEDTPSRGKIVKEPLRFYKLEPTVPWHNSRSTFLRFEDVFLLSNSKIRFLIFTVLPLNLF
jgi:hypothetical protein